MNDVILITGIGTIGVLLVKALELFERRLTRQLKQMHKDIRRAIELSFWSQKREQEARKILRKSGVDERLEEIKFMTMIEN